MDRSAAESTRTKKENKPTAWPLSSARILDSTPLHWSCSGAMPDLSSVAPQALDLYAFLLFRLERGSCPCGVGWVHWPRVTPGDLH